MLHEARMNFQRTIVNQAPRFPCRGAAQFNEPIHAFDLEVKVQPEKGEARSRNSCQPESDPQAMREYRQALRQLQVER
jgi:hypothetical protein